MNGEIHYVNGRAFVETPEGMRAAICGGYEYVALGAAAVALVAAGVSAYGQYEAGQAQKAAFGYQQDVANQQADAARAAAKIAGDTRKRELERTQAAQRARLGASGVIPGEGSPLLVQMESARQAQIELQRIQYAGATQATSFQAQGILSGFYGTQARRAANIGAGTTLLSGLSNSASIGAGAYRGGGGSSPQSQAP